MPVANRISRSVLCLVFTACLVPIAAPSSARGEETTVTVSIDYDDGVQKRFTRLKWRAGLTVLEVTEAAKRHPRGIRFKYRGKGVTAFLYEIDGLKNEPQGRAWLYRVNGKRGDRSFATFPLKAGDTVLWEFTNY